MSLRRASSPFSHVVDIFGDGTLRALSTPGHARDHLAYLINTARGKIVVEEDVADALKRGKLGGYAGGLELKARLLAMEQSRPKQGALL